MCTFYRHFERYGHISDNTICNHFDALNRKAMRTAMKKSDLELSLILSKIYLYLGHHYMDIQYYDKANNLARKCQRLNIEICSQSPKLCIEVKNISYII